MLVQQAVKGFDFSDPDQVIQILPGMGKMFADVGIDLDAGFFQFAIQYRFQ